MAPEQPVAPMPYFACASSLIGIWPLRYFWNDPPSFVQHAWSAIFFAVAVYFIVVMALTAAMAMCWRWWRSKRG